MRDAGEERSVRCLGHCYGEVVATTEPSIASGLSYCDRRSVAAAWNLGLVLRREHSHDSTEVVHRPAHRSDI